MSQSDARFAIVACAIWVAFAGLRWGTWSVAGADSYGYVSEASLLAKGSLVIEQPIAREVPWPEADWTFAPLAYRPGLQPGTIVPIYPPGLPIPMALFQLVGGDRAVYLVVPLLAALGLLATAVLATRVAGVTAGVFAALLLATSPTMLYAVMWPMSDVPAAAWWAITLALATGAGTTSALGAGFGAAFAILTRPNLVGLAVAPACYLAAQVWARGANRRLAVVRMAAFTTVTALGCLAVAALHTSLYGSPVLSGHGEVRNLFEASLAPANLVGFATRPFGTEPWLALLSIVGAAALATGRVRSHGSSIGWLSAGTAGLVLASYLFYQSWGDWTYLRFLLPAYPGLAVLAGTGAVWVADRVPGFGRVIALSFVAVAIVLTGTAIAVERNVFRLDVSEARYEIVADFARDELPPNALFLSYQQSGSLRYYADRLTVRFDTLPPEWLERAVADLTARGYHPFFVVEAPETDLFRERFQGTTPLGRLDWPAAAEYDGEVGVTIFDPADRARWLDGQTIATRSIGP